MSCVSAINSIIGCARALMTCYFCHYVVRVVLVMTSLRRDVMTRVTSQSQRCMRDSVMVRAVYRAI